MEAPWWRLTGSATMTEALEQHDDFVQATIPGRYVLEMLASQPGGGAGLLATAGIADDGLRSPGYRVSGAQMEALHHALVRGSDDELYGVFRRPVPRGTYAAYVRQATGYRDLRAVFVGATDLYGLFGGGRRRHCRRVSSIRGRVELRIVRIEAPRRGDDGQHHEGQSAGSRAPKRCHGSIVPAPPAKMLFDRIGEDGKSRVRDALEDIVQERYGGGPARFSNAATVGTATVS